MIQTLLKKEGILSTQKIRKQYIKILLLFNNMETIWNTQYNNYDIILKKIIFEDIEILELSFTDNKKQINYQIIYNLFDDIKEYYDEFIEYSVNMIIELLEEIN